MKNIYRIETNNWYIERIIFLVAGILILTGVILSLLVNSNWLILVVLVGVMMVVFSITGYCPMAILLHKIGKKGKCNR